MRIRCIFITLLVAYALFADDGLSPEELVRQLDDDDWRVRKRAYARLEMLGASAVDALKKALKESDSLEVHIRVSELLKKIKTVSPEGAERLRRLSEEFFKASDAKKKSIIKKMRPVPNAVFWVLSRLSKSGGRRKWAELLYWFEFGRRPKPLNEKLSLTEEVLSQIIWHPYTRSDVRTEAIRLLGMVGTVGTVGTLFLILSGEPLGNMYYEATERNITHQKRMAREALIAIVNRDPACKEHAPKRGDFISDWWDRFKKVCGDAAKDYELRQKNEERRKKNQPFLGVATMTDPSEKLGGAVIMRPEPGTGAFRAGIKPDDIITELDGWKIECWNDLIHAIRHCEVGDRVTATIKRGKKTLKLKDIEITRRPDSR